MRALVPLLAAALVTLAFSLSPGGLSSQAATPPGSAQAAPRPLLRVECALPRTLRLHRFEDGSARLECAGRTLVRISVPG